MHSFQVQYKKHSVVITHNTGNPSLDAGVSLTAFYKGDRPKIQKIKRSISRKPIQRIDDVYSLARKHDVVVVPVKIACHKRYNSARIGF